MNINDVKDVPRPPNNDYILGIYNRQVELHKKYKPIEQKNKIGLGLIQDREFNIDDRFFQYVIKDYFWRITEELAECYEAILEDDEIHAIEEAIDALHFYTELLIILDEKPGIVVIGSQSLRVKCDEMWMAVYTIGLAANCLKQKPWKNSPFITDKKLFYDYIDQGYRYLINWMALYFDLSLEEIYIFYMKKSEVNRFRIRSNY